MDAIAISGVDISGIAALKDLHRKRKERRIHLVWVCRKSEIVDSLKPMGLFSERAKKVTYPSLRQAVNPSRLADSRTGL